VRGAIVIGALVRRWRTGFPTDLEPLTVRSGWLEGDRVTVLPMHNSWHYPVLAGGRPQAIVAHYSATNPGTALSMARRRQKPWHEFAKGYEPGKAPQNSWHLSVEQDGSIVQMGSLLWGTWHAGGPTARKIPGVGYANRTAIGIELIGYGRRWDEPQIEGAARVWRAIVQTYAVPRSLAMVTHAELDPGRRSDPGSLWMGKPAGRVLAWAYA
jgi:N-acetyl-anhydromuramyl-L-alanine amidase AmpD